MTFTRTTFAALALTALSGLSMAQTPQTPVVDQRQANQQARIAAGAANGSLTARETQRLEREQAVINKAETKAKSDGTVTAKERARLDRLQDGASRDIRAKKHNGRAASTPG